MTELCLTTYPFQFQIGALIDQRNEARLEALNHMNLVLQIIVMSCKCDCITSCGDWRRQH